MAASTNTVTSKEYSNGVRTIAINYLASDGTLSPETIYGLEGKKIVGITVAGGATGPTANCDLAIVYFPPGSTTASVNVVATNGANAVDGNNTVNFVQLDSDATPAIVTGPLTVAPDLLSENLVATAETTVTLVLQSSFS